MRQKFKIEFDQVFTKYLDAQQKLKTKRCYAGFLRSWIAYTGLNGQASLDLKREDKDAETEKKVLGFQKWLIDNKSSENTAKTAAACVRGFYANNRMPLTFVRSEAKQLNEANRSTEDYLFSKEDLQKMSEQAILFPDKYVLLVGKSLGLRAGDFLNLTFGKFRGIHLNTEPPVAMGETVTRKERVRAYPYLDSDAVPVVNAVLEMNKDKADSARVLDFADENTLTQIIQRLFKKARLVDGGKQVRFHNLRKYLIDRLSAVASESQWKQLVGKKVSENAYVSQDQLRDIYLRAMPSIVINGNRNHAKIEELEEKIAAMNRLIGDQTMTLEALKQRDMERSKAIEELKAQMDSLDVVELRKRLKILREVKRLEEKSVPGRQR